MACGDDPVDGQEQQAVARAGLYVDLENLHSDGQAMVDNLIENWPDNVPPVSRLMLYVRADQVELWRLWATSRFAGLEVVVNGTQHFSLSPTKNSADIAIATNAMADLVLQRVTHIVVFSDDSDFISLYVAIRDELGIPSSGGKVPFLWVVTDREGSLSATVKKFFPLGQLHLISADGKRNGGRAPVSTSPRLEGTSDSHVATADIHIAMARAVVAEIGVGPFKSTDCQRIIRECWHSHPLASAGGAAFGVEFKNNIWPVLERWGVRVSNPGKKPIRYEMTEEAKLASV